MIGAQPVEAGLLQKLAPPDFQQQGVDVGVRFQTGDRRRIFPDVRLDVRQLKLAGHRDPVIAILDEVRAADLEQFDRRHARAPRIEIERRDALPPLAQAVVAGQKGAGEIQVAPHAAHDAIQRDVLQALVNRVHQIEPLRNVAEVQQLFVTAFQTVQCLRLARFAPGTVPLAAGFVGIVSRYHGLALMQCRGNNKVEPQTHYIGNASFRDR